MNGWSILALVALMSTMTYTQEYARVCYVTNWAQYRPQPATFFPSQTDPTLCTHVNFAFANVSTSFQVVNTEWNDIIPGGLYDQTIALKERQPGLMVLIAIGGYTHGMWQINDMLSTPENRATFISSSIQFCRTWGFDGVDLDFQFPSGDQKFQFTSLLQEFRTAITNEAALTGKEPLLLTIDVGAQKMTIDKAYEVDLIHQYVDFINIMTYDYNGGWDSITGMNAPLYPRPDEFIVGDDFQNRSTRNLDWSATYWVQLGAPSRKLVLGLALYGRSFKLENLALTGVGAPAAGYGLPGTYTREAGFLSYYEICLAITQGATRVFHDVHLNPYAYRGDQWIGYDDEESLKYKVDYIKANAFAGWMAWNMDLDDFSGNLGCNAGPYPLLHAVNRFLADTSTFPTAGSTAAPPSSSLGPLPATSSFIPPAKRLARKSRNNVRN
jgi:chitinase